MIGPRRALRALSRRVWETRELRVYMCPAESVGSLPHPRRCRRDQWEDLQYAQAWSYGHLTRDQYLAAIEERRRSPPHHLYSVVENGVLVHYGWLTAPQERAPDQGLGLVFHPPAGSVALWDYFTDPSARGRGLYRDSLWQCMHDAVDLDGARYVFIYVYGDNVASRRVIERVGFTYQGSLVLERRLFRTSRYGTFTDRPLDVRLLATDRAVPVFQVGIGALRDERSARSETLAAPRAEEPLDAGVRGS